MAKKLIKNYVFNPGLGLDDNARPFAYTLISDNKAYLQAEIVAYIQAQVDAGDPDYVGYTYSEAKCLRDSGYVIDALLFDLRYGGNEETRRVSGLYWNQDVPQIDGNRIPEYEAYQFLRDEINTYILTNTTNPSPQQEVVTQTTNENNGESGTDTRVTALLNDVVSVIQNGLDDLPDLDIGLGRIELLGKVQLEELLIITNATDNVVIYNFTEPTLGAETTFTEGNSLSYPTATEVNEGTTIINFKYDTSAMSSTDKIQIFLESTELKIRPYDFGTDAIERMRVGIPQAMIDADFEYGLQPTKWQAIGTMRGYPSTYEIPASEIPVTNVTTDASTGSSGVGASLITVTTETLHGLEAGDIITIKALASSILGFNRAEGTFIIYDVPTTTTFRYYAKAKVGTSSGQVLATTTTQLREASFYTGAAIGNPTLTVATNGSSGSFTTPFIVPSGSTTIGFIGAVPPNGAPLSGTGIDTGTQVTGSQGSGGSVWTVRVKTSVSSGATAIVLEDTSQIAAGMVIPDDWFDSTTPEQRVITSIVGDTINLGSAITTNYTGDFEDYTVTLNAARNQNTGSGSSATFTVSVNAGVYESVSVDTQGSGYAVGDTLQILGNTMGGVLGDNDLYLKVISVGEDSTAGSLQEVQILSGTGTGTNTYSSLTASNSSNPVAANGQIQIQRSDGGYSFNGLITSGTDIYNGETYVIPGTDLGGTSPANDATVVLSSTLGEGPNWDTATVTGTGVRGDNFDVYSAVTVSQATTSQLGVGDTITYSAIATIQAEFVSNHGLLPGTSIMVSINSDNGSNNHELASGPFFVDEVTALDTIQYTVRSPGNVDTSSIALDGQIYIRPDSFFTHRPFDGGVQLGTGGPQHGAQAIRQSKKYIRYQSGKGAMYNTGALFAPSYDLQSATATGTASGSIITITVDDQDHGLQSGSRVRLNGIKTVGYDGDYTVNSIVDERSYTVVATTALGNTTAVIGPQCQMSTLNWHGAVVRSGPFDDQNGIFFQYDGQELSVVRRTSTFQIAGTIAIETEKNTVTGTNTRFLDQLKEGDRIVIRGMTHVVTNIASATSMTVTPDFRGVENITGVKASKVEDLIIPQSQWNLDKCDGTGPSGYNIDITKMQMIGIQFSWYGAGFIDWMFRGANGDYVFCHRLKGNNLNTEAYMRTGNLPVRYEVTNESPSARLDGAITDVATSLVLNDASNFPTSGTLYIDNEVITYTGKTNNTLTGLSRSANLSNFAAGATRTYSAGDAAAHNDEQGVVLISSTTSPIISHWGSAYMIDGQFDEDRGYIFSYSETNVTASTTKQTAFMLRLAPSVSNAIVGDLGTRELLNRAQLLLQSIEVTSDTGTGGIVVEGIINPVNYPVAPELVGWSGLSGLAQGGQPSFAQIASGGAITWDTGASSSTADITAQAVMTTTADTNDSTNASAEFLYMVWSGSGTGLDGQGIRPGDGVSGSGLASGLTVTYVSAPYVFNGNLEVEVGLSGKTGTNIANGDTITFSRGGDLDKRSFGYFTKASVDAAGVTLGTPVDSTSASPSWPANTQVSQIVENTFGATQYYDIRFNNASSGTLTAGTGTVTLLFSQPAYAQPGETVFSFIAQPGELASLNLSELKELTNTTIGGRGAFPNGPDVLAINIYRTSGSDIDANIILRWGEAQA